MSDRDGAVKVRGAVRKHSDRPTTVAPVSTLRRWLNRVLLSVGSVLVVAGLYQGGTALKAQQVETLTVLGDVRHIDVNAIQERLAPRVAAGFFAADLSELQRELESLPWVYKVNTRRRWPAEIEVSLIEHRPLARWGSAGYLNHEGQLFVADQDPIYQHLPLLNGPAGAEAELMRRYQTLAALLEPDGLSISALSLDSLGQLSLQLGNGVALMLGGEEMLRRVTRFRQLWNGALPTRAVARVDLRYEHGAAVTFNEPGLAMQSMHNGGEG